MDVLQPDFVQRELDRRAGVNVYLHIETTTGTYTALGPDAMPPCIAFVRNARIAYERGSVRGQGPYRVGLKMDGGWVYGDGLTHATVDEDDRLLLAGFDGDGRLRIALQLATTPFREGDEA